MAFQKKHFHFVCIILLLLASNCGSSSPYIAEEIDIQNITTAQHLIFIGLDGWGGAYLPGADMPTVKRMMAQGASSIYTQCIMPSNSWANWVSLFSGTLIRQRNSRQFPTIFSLVNNDSQEIRSVFFYEWSDLDRICPDDITVKRRILSDLESTENIVSYITSVKPFFTAVVFNEPDSAGHGSGWGSAAYNAKLTELDGYIAAIEQAVIDAGIYDNTVFVLSSDHGGSYRGHGTNNPLHRRIPIIFYGRGIKQGHTISHPESGICNIDPTMALILGLGIPPEWRARPLLEVFE